MATRGPLRRVLWAGAVAMLLSLGAAGPARAEFEYLTEWGAPKAGEVVLPFGVDQDQGGNTYVIDPLARVVQKFDSSNNPVLRWGGLGSGPGEFEFPFAIGVNAATGEVYVADVSAFGILGPTPRARIQRFDSNGNFLGEFGNLGTAEGQFSEPPSGITVDPATGRVFVVDGERVQRFSGAGQFQRMWGKDVDPGGGTDAEVCTANCKAALSGTAEGEFASPTDVATNGAQVYVVDHQNKRVQRFSADGAFQIMGGRDVDTAGGTGFETCMANCKRGETGTTLGALEEPQGIDVNTALGFVYIVDQDNHRVQRWQGNLTPIDQFGAQGSGDGQFLTPDAIAEQQGKVVVTDLFLRRLQQFTGLGAFQTRFGEPGQATLGSPNGIGAGPGGVYVSEDQDRVVRYDGNGNFLGTWGSTGTAAGQFLFPRGIAADNSGNVYVADYLNARIQRFDVNGAALGAWGSQGGGNAEFDLPVDVATAPDGTVYTLEESPNARVQKFSSIGFFMGTWGAPGSAPGQMSGEGIATDSAGNVYVADTHNHRIQKFDPNGALLTAWGSEGTGDGQFQGPADVAVDRLGNVYVADQGNHRVQRFDTAGNFLGRWGANGADGTPGDGPGEFISPNSIAVDAPGDIYVLDSLNSRVQKFARANEAPGLSAPDLSLNGRKRQSPARLRVKAGCGGAPCEVDITGKVTARPNGGGKSGLAAVKRKLKPKSVDLNAGDKATVRLKLKRQKKSVRKLKSVLADGGRGKAVIRGRATNAAGADTARLRVKLKR